MFVECGCDPRGSENSRCNNVTGICQCKDGVEGDKCDQCSLGTQDLDRGCVGMVVLIVISVCCVNVCRVQNVRSVSDR